MVCSIKYAIRLDHMLGKQMTDIVCEGFTVSAFFTIETGYHYIIIVRIAAALWLHVVL